MGRYIIRRVLQGILTLFLVMFLLHLLTTAAIQLNGNPALAFFGDRIPSPSQLAAVEERYGLGDPCYDQFGNPCITQFFQRLQDYAALDFGTNHRGREVTDIVATAAPNTLRLFVVVTITWLVMGMFLGSIAARFRGKAADHSIRFLSILIDAFPVFVMLLVYKFIFAVQLSNFMGRVFGHDSVLSLLFRPSFSREHPWATIIIPAALLGLTGAAPFLRLVRASQLENYNADHVRTARSKGLKDGYVTLFHIVRNSSIPVVTALGFVFAEALGGAVITEGLMNIYGMGGVLWQSVQDSEVSVVIGIVSLLSISTVIVMFLVDIVYGILDPRIRYD